MYDEKPKFENQIISKKSNKINEQTTNSKKGKKNKKQLRQDKPVVEIKQLQRNQRPQPVGKTVTLNKNKSQGNEQKIFADLCSVMSEYKSGTILKILEETNFDKQQAYAKLCEMVPDADCDKEDKKQEDLWNQQFDKYNKSTRNQSENNSSSQAPSEVANTLMNQFFDTLLKEEINGRQFQQLFEEIAQMIKEDQKQKGVGMLEINNLVDECHSIKQTLLVGFRQELSNFDDFQFDQASPLYAQIQKFTEDLIGKQVKQQKKLQQDFPMLSFGGNSQKNIVEKIKQQNKIKKQQQHFFTPSRVHLPKFARQKNNQMSIFNVDNNLKSEKDLISLHKQFLDIPIIDLKFIYKALAGDYNICRQFLLKHYKRNVKFIREVQTVTYKNTSNNHKMSYSHHHMRGQEIDEQLKHLSLQEIREELDHLYKLRQAFKLTKMKIKNNHQRKEIDRICNQRQPLIKKLSLAARIKTLQLMAKSDPHYVDLHGYREEQIDDLLEAITRMINEQFNLGNQKVKIRTVRGRKAACLVMMTGKGIHSRGNKSILKPAIQSWCRQNGVDYDQEVDHIKVYILIK